MRSVLRIYIYVDLVINASDVTVAEECVTKIIQICDVHITREARPVIMVNNSKRAHGHAAGISRICATYD